jgi:hypothetical protein
VGEGKRRRREGEEREREMTGLSRAGLIKSGKGK